MVQLNSVSFNTTGNEEYINGTERNSTCPTSVMVEGVLPTLSLLLSLFGLSGNCMVLWYLGFRIKRNKFTVYILNLAVADFMSLFCYSAFLVCMIINLHVSVVPQVFMITLEISFIFGYNTDLYLLTAISVERCLSVHHPIWYQCKRPKHQSAIICGLLWSLSCFVTLLEYFLCLEETHQVLGTEGSCNVGLFVFMCLIDFLIFIPAMALSNLILLIQIRRTSLQPQSKKLYIAVAITVFAFLLSAVPARLVSLLKYQNLVYDRTFKYVTVVCSSINSSSNPFIYFFVGSQKRLGCQGSIAEGLQRVFKEETETSQPGLETTLSTKIKARFVNSVHWK